MPSLVLGNSSYHEAWANNSTTKSHTVAAGNDRLLLVGVARQTTGGANPGVASVTFNGSAMTLVPNSKATSSDGLETLWYYMIAPPAITADVAISLGASSNANIMAWIRDYSNHDGAAPVGNYKGTNNSGSATSVVTSSITEAIDDLILTLANHGGGGATVTWTNATELGDDNYSSMGASLAHRTAVGANTFTQTATISTGVYQATISAVLVKPKASPPTVNSVTPSSAYPTQEIVVALSNFSSPPAAGNCTLGGVAISPKAGATTSEVRFDMPARSAFRYGGVHASRRFGVGMTLVVGNGTDSASGTVTPIAEQAGGFGAKDSGTSPYNLGTYNGGLIALATGDDVWIHVVSGSAGVNPSVPEITPYSSTVVADAQFYDVSQGSWSGLSNAMNYSEPQVFTGALVAAPAQMAGTLAMRFTGNPAAQPAHTAGTFVVTSKFGGALAAGVSTLAGQMLLQARATEVIPYTRVVARHNRAVSISFVSAVVYAYGTVTYSIVGTLPAGMTLNPTTGVISGTPTVLGETLFTLRVTAASGIGDVAVEWDTQKDIPRLGLPSTRSAVFVVGF